VQLAKFQDLAYGRAYLDRVEALAALDRAPHDLTREAAKHIANAMAYDDIIRVADEKTRAGRSGRIAAEMGASQDKVMQVTDGKYHADVKPVGNGSVVHILLYGGTTSKLASLQYNAAGAGSYQPWSVRSSVVYVTFSSGVEVATIDIDSTGPSGLTPTTPSPRTSPTATSTGAAPST